MPTTKEAGLPEFQASAWNALFAPKGTPKPVLDKLSAALDKALDDEATRKRLLDLGSDIPGKDRRGQDAFGEARGERDRPLGAGDQGVGRDAITRYSQNVGKGGLRAALFTCGTAMHSPYRGVFARPPIAR